VLRINNSTKRKEKFCVVLPFFCSHKYHKIANNFIFEQVKKFFFVLFTQKIVIKLSKIWGWDPGSGIRGPGSGKTYSGSRIQGQKGTDPQH
jgi:hypothetical protein